MHVFVHFTYFSQICDVTCQNQAFEAEIGCLVRILLRKSVILAIIIYYLCLYDIPIQSYVY